MKFPKHRANCFVVTRMIGDDTTVLGVFPTYEGADSFMGACEQDWKDSNAPYTPSFEVYMTTYYDA
jgi:hypothetical protein